MCRRPEKTKNENQVLNSASFSVSLHSTKTGKRLKKYTSFLTIITALTLPVFLHKPPTAYAQLSSNVIEQADPNAQMVIEADELIYNNDDNTVTAIGGVQIFYDGYTVEAEKVRFNRSTQRVFAEENIKIIEPTGNILYAKSADLTDSLSDGFIEALRIETADNTRFAAANARRENDGVTILEKGVYTACETCKDNPKKPPTWQVKATRIIYDREEKSVYYSNARFELFGVPIAYIPAFSHADPSVKRKSGFLAPGYLYNSRFGTRIDTPYFFNLAPSYDITLTPYITSKQGFLGRAEWRQRLKKGAYSLRASGIKQADPKEFTGESGDKNWRYSLESKGQFHLNKRWKTGWDATYISDRNYLKDYKFQKAGDKEIISQSYLTGLHDRNYFDARLQHFKVTRSPVLVSGTNTNIIDPQRFQPVIHPVIDYDYTFNKSILGGQLGFTANITSLTRDQDHIVTQAYNTKTGITALGTPLYYGFEGSYTRATIDVHWKRQIIGPLGQVFKPFFSLRGDAIFQDLSGNAPQAAGINTSETFFRAMPSIGLEYRWPFLVSSSWGSQIFEPIAQIIVRPNETRIGSLPNEDAQSLVFEASNLFDTDKFSGFDRAEGGTRANLGFKYSLNFGQSALTASFGQSFQLAGRNSFVKQDPILIGSASGLESDISDYVASMTLSPVAGIKTGVRARFDDHDFSVRRFDASASFSKGDLSGSATYTFLEDNPAIGINEDREQASAALSYKLSESISAFANATYDIQNESLISHGIGMGYHDECIALSLTYNRTFNRYSNDETGQTLYLQFSLRTIGDGQLSTNLAETAN